MIGMSFVTMTWAIFLMRKISKRKKDSFAVQPQAYAVRIRNAYTNPSTATNVHSTQSAIREKPKPEPARIEFNELKRYFPQTLGNAQSYQPIKLAPSNVQMPQSMVSATKRQAVYSMLDEMGVYTGKAVVQNQQSIIRKKPVQHNVIPRSEKDDMLSRLKKAYA